jgi:two-component sensor histidine kinase
MQAPKGLAGDDSALMAAQRAETAPGKFDGVEAAVISLNALRPEASDKTAPPGAQVALANRQGRLLTATNPLAFPARPPDLARSAGPSGAGLYRGVDRLGQARILSAAPLSDDVFVLLSAPAPALFSWARLNPLSSLALPFLAFAIALAAVWIVADRVIVRWLDYLQRIAGLYAKGRLSVRPLQADRAPAEIRDLAQALEAMVESIAARDASLRASLDEKDALMREIHHRVKNNLQVISSLISLQERALADVGARGALADTRRRIAALALIYRALYHSPDLKRVDLRQFLGDLMGQLVTEQPNLGHAVRTELSADELIIDPDKLAPFALFAVEAISNAQKHALAVRGGLLRVAFIVQDDQAELTVADEGSGTAPALAVSGVGRTLMAAFTRQLRGRMDLDANAMGGVTVRLVFPAPALGLASRRNGRGRAKGRAAIAA